MAKGLYFGPCMLKRKMLSAYLLLTLLFLQGAGWFIAWKIAEADAKLVAFHTMNSKGSQMFVFRLSLSDFEKQRIDEQEILLNGGLYDIRSCTLQHDTVQLEIYHDLEEEGLLRCLAEWAGKGSNADPQPFAQMLGKWLQAVFIVPSCLPLPMLAVQSGQDNFATDNWQSAYAAAPQAPPPKLH